MQRFEDCIKITDEVIEKDKLEPKGYYLKGQALIGLNELMKAKECFEAGLELG